MKVKAERRVRVVLTFDEQTTKDFLEFFDRENFDSYTSACRVLVQYALQEAPKHFPRGVWTQALYEARTYAFQETSRFLHDLARQMINVGALKEPTLLRGYEDPP